MAIIPTVASYCAEHGIKPEIIKENCGWLAILGCWFDGWGLFNADQGDDAVDAAMIMIGDEIFDFANYCAWPVDSPGSFATDENTATCPLLGSWNLYNPASWAFGERLMVHRTPLRWLKSGCRGVVVLDHRMGFQRLREAHGDLEAEDEEHAALLKDLINPKPFEHKIMVG